MWCRPGSSGLPAFTVLSAHPSWRADYVPEVTDRRACSQVKPGSLAPIFTQRIGPQLVRRTRSGGCGRPIRGNGDRVGVLVLETIMFRCPWRPGTQDLMPPLFVHRRTRCPYDHELGPGLCTGTGPDSRLGWRRRQTGHMAPDPYREPAATYRTRTARIHCPAGSVRARRADARICMPLRAYGTWPMASS